MYFDPGQPHFNIADGTPAIEYSDYHTASTSPSNIDFLAILS